ncbi:MAG: response regulator transcription factor [Acidaminobacteraceae bacterium]
MSVKILVVDDEIRFRELISDFLVKEGYEVIKAKDGREAIDLFFSNEKIDLVILDVMLPYYSGLEVCKAIRSKSQTPILMLTALSEEYDEVRALDIGADEYISKPFSYPILVARVNALIRRTNASEENLIHIDGVTINEQSHKILVDNEEIELSPKEYKLIIYLVKNKGRALSRYQIINNVWSYDFYGDSRTVDSHIKSVRSKLGKYGDYIKTIRGLGYKLEVKR